MVRRPVTMMTEYIPDSPLLSRLYCPGCEPGADPSQEILDVRWCARHAPAYSGSDDVGVNVDAFLAGSIEAGGEVNRRWCDLLHRGRISTPPAEPPRRRDRRAHRSDRTSVA